MLETEQFDIGIVAETAVDELRQPYLLHDDYELKIHNPVMNVGDQRNATGRGIMLFSKKGLVVEKIFPKMNDDKLLIAKI